VYNWHNWIPNQNLKQKMYSHLLYICTLLNGISILANISNPFFVCKPGFEKFIIINLDCSERRYDWATFSTWSGVTDFHIEIPLLFEYHFEGGWWLVQFKKYFYSTKNNKSFKMEINYVYIFTPTFVFLEILLLDLIFSLNIKNIIKKK
jgi:hypothetical protein